MKPDDLPSWLAEFEFHADAVPQLDPDGRLTEFNDEAAGLFNLDKVRDLGRPIAEVIEFRDEANGSTPTNLTERIVVPTSGGDLRSFAFKVVPLGEGRGWLTVISRTLPPLVTESRAWAEFAKSSSQGIAMSDPDSRKLGIVSEAFAAMHGYAAHEMFGMPVERLFPDHNEELQAFWSALEIDGIQTW